MRWMITFCSICLIMLSGCDLREREAELEKKMNEVAQKEQELLLKEKSLQLKEEELNRREKLLDSTSNKTATDSLPLLHPQLPGTWLVKMTCMEATCPGSAVGDTKTENWKFSYENNVVVARAMSGGNLIRIYTGTYAGNSLELSVQQNEADTIPAAKMTVRLQQTKENAMEGQREITRAEGCRVVYELDLTKQDIF